MTKSTPLCIVCKQCGEVEDVSKNAESHVLALLVSSEVSLWYLLLFAISGRVFPCMFKVYLYG